MNERNEINGDLADEYDAIQEAELLEESPIISLDDDDLEGWYQEWLAEQDHAEIDDPLMNFLRD